MATGSIESVPTPAGPSRAWTKGLGQLALVLLVCAGLRVWLIRHTEVIAKDGLVYIEMARAWSADPLAVARDYSYHIGYPVSMVGCHRALTALGGPADPPGWELSGQIISLLAGLAAMIAVWLFAGMVFDWRVAWVTALVFGVGRKWAALSADVLSDALAVCLQMWALVLALAAVTWLGRRSKRALVLAAGVGLCSGAGYLVRPEALLVPVLAAVLWLACQLRTRASWRLTLASMGVALLTTAACAAPYVAAIGGLTHKKNLRDILALHVAGGGGPGRAGVALLPLAATCKFLSQLTEAMHPAVATLAGLWLAAWIGMRVLRLRLPPAGSVSPRWPGAVVMVAAAAILAPLWINFHTKVGYLSHRHVMFLAAVLSPLAGAGALLLAECVRALAKAAGLRLAAGAVIGLVVGGTAVGLIVHSLRPLHAGKGYLREAGKYVGSISGPDDFLLTDSARVIYYAQVKGHRLYHTEISRQALLRHVPPPGPGVTYVAISNAELSRAPGLRDWLDQPAFVPLREFVRPGQAGTDRIRVYRVDVEALEAARASPSIRPVTYSPGGDDMGARQPPGRHAYCPGT